MNQDETDAEILAAAIADPARFTVLYERHLAAIAGYLGRRVGAELAEDLTAEVFVRAFRARHRYRPEHDSALPWLLGIAGNLVADNRRAERRRLALLAQLAGSAVEPPGSVAARGESLDGELARQLHKLPAADRDALLLTVWGELSYEEAATALGVPVGTVRSRIFRARRRLAAALRLTGDTPSAERSHRPARGGARA
jgi:RNA polymerase sigma factor (sigma-70 family)